MTPDSASRLKYSRHEVRVDPADDVDRLVPRLAALDDVVAVNIAGDPEAASVALSRDNLREALEKRPASIVLEVIARADFNSILRAKITQVEGEALALRQALRTEYVADNMAGVTQFLTHLEQTLLLLDGFALQKADSPLQALIATLGTSRLSLISGLTRADDVLCMDAVQHEIVPALRAIAPSFLS